MAVLAQLEPEEVFHWFEEICGIPHGSGDTGRISDFLVDFAQKRSLKYRQDRSNNVIIWKDASEGYEDSEPVMLQGHMDMVCEKEPDCDIDFSGDGLRLKLEDGIISADGTTLGGDDGIAVAYALAVLDADDIAHPPLEVVFTVDEEIGMLGAAALDCSDLKSRIMLNLDSEDEGHLLVSCAGGVTAEAHLPVQKAAVTGRKVRLVVTGLQGGHSGVEIDKGRGNACQLLGRTLYELKQKCDYRLNGMKGGLKDNAIPREAEAELILLEKDGEKVIRAMEQVYQKEYSVTDPQVKLLWEEEEDPESQTAMTEEATAKAVTALVNLPGGIQRMSFDIPGLVQTSLNLGIMRTDDTEISFSFSVRSSVGTEKAELVQRIRCLMEALGGSVSCTGEYPAWEYRQESALRDLMVQIYEEQYGEKPLVEALHAGVECGLFADKLPGLDCVSFGPDMDDIHTTKESMNVDSVRRTWKYVLEILKRLK
ncbi:MAG: aminoacyl-histidine dipeptidase [Lachnospiraceae bacterium]|nr:aminoacyl-histidine dipeptidase [Lachnospiraceae bacterium]